MQEKLIPAILELESDEYADFYKEYISNIPGGTLQDILTADLTKWEALFKNLTDAEGLKAYAPGKWTVKEMILHCIDTERIFCTRALMIARGETKSISGYDHELYAAHSNANDRSIESLKTELLAQRHSTRTLFDTFSNSDLQKAGVANNNKLSVRAIAYIIPGHCMHHFKVLRERYGVSF
ncbi:DinB family protein [Cryomorpha ignava]|uniref:DinB family protein n=1 Tax=Cryomorpha ignava TaxID=101383 RepID=A0A7K3WJY6_9FLAO|nr:DinB family protein [Cryomorpha ignava]NEN21957.1 DinB family protein [Cryomorpha ignava]